MFYLLSLPFALYVAYLATWRTYKRDGFYGEPSDERYLFPRIVYVLIWMVAFVPLVNLAVAVVLMSVFLVEPDYCVKSWLLEKPGEKEESPSGEAAGHQQE